jgi:hypothetical protein
MTDHTTSVRVPDERASNRRTPRAKSKRATISMPDQKREGTAARPTISISSMSVSMAT